MLHPLFAFVRRRHNLIMQMGKVRSRAFYFLEHELANAGIRDISPSLGDILFIVAVKEPVEMRQVAVLLGRDKSTLTVQVNNLLKNGYISRSTAKEDRRRAKITLTTKGRKVMPVLFRIGGKLERKMLQGLSIADVEKHAHFLEKLFENLTDS